MTLYGKAAVLAVRMCRSNPGMTPAKAWAEAVAKCSTSSETQRKVCPREAFLGLCAGGYVSDVVPGTYGTGEKNKTYATRAAMLLRRIPALANDPLELWLQVAGPSKVPNGQMGVVIALWQEEMLKKT